MGIDRPYENNLDTPPRINDNVRICYETRDKATYYEELRAAVAADNWSSTVAEFRSAWASYTHDHPPREPDPARESTDGSWTGNGDRHLDRQANSDVDRGRDRIHETEETVITPAMRRIEAEDPTRQLVGLEHRLKGPDRIKEKVAATMEEQPNRSTEQALALVKDLIRYTFQYSDDRYTDGVQSDTARLRRAGFELLELRNSWDRAEYKGINSRWREQASGLLFEVQFHTEASFDAKQLTHPAYELLRDPTTTDEEARTLRGLQRELCRSISIPPKAMDISNLP